eukprot:CAMPEP_0184724802 /NCGR_PEP_ID=MMETSP0314-20130426/28982_1 /TAXON_ID=38298 /ORGANISM="Rhodella maculata, Strain CCMP 736" /LENGTH=78 /DNA_ID=CAMNT_0027189873 /DNA_START=99 /DNA_END=336 /DNA_ORIENTATION=-
MDSIKETLGLADNRTPAQKFGDGVVDAKDAAVAGVGDAANAVSDTVTGAASTTPKQQAADNVGNAVQGAADSVKGAMK